ncbi:hypothetical protein FPQ18DRAFT_93244 [Pyronema domesticum]|nr:hypothetical protein FPQ18DRAFT_93244 [Pyronema domesticum]
MRNNAARDYSSTQSFAYNICFMSLWSCSAVCFFYVFLICGFGRIAGYTLSVIYVQTVVKEKQKVAFMKLCFCFNCWLLFCILFYVSIRQGGF